MIHGSSALYYTVQSFDSDGTNKMEDANDEKTAPDFSGAVCLYYFLIKLFNLIKKALPDGIADYVIFGKQNHIIPSHMILISKTSILTN